MSISKVALTDLRIELNRIRQVDDTMFTALVMITNFIEEMDQRLDRMDSRLERIENDEIERKYKP